MGLITLKSTAPDPDAQWFALHPDRYARIRVPELVLEKDMQRAVNYVTECEREFRSLGDHQRHRRRIILWRVPADNAYYDPDKPQILKIPFLLFSEETVEDRDDVLLPIIHELMMDAAKREKIV